MDIRLCALFVLINQITFHFSHVGNVYVLLYVDPALSHWCLPLFPWPFNLESPRCGWNRRKANILSLQILTVPGNEGVRPLLLVYDLRHAFFFFFFFFFPPCWRPFCCFSSFISRRHRGLHSLFAPSTLYHNGRKSLKCSGKLPPSRALMYNGCDFGGTSVHAPVRTVRRIICSWSRFSYSMARDVG